MTMLQLATLESYEKCYDWTPNKSSVSEAAIVD